VSNCCSIYKDDIFYVHAPYRDGLYILDLDCNETHINSVDAKICKLSDDNTMYMWHCCLGHVGVKRMNKLHQDGLLGLLDFDSFDMCEPCLMGKMIRTPFTSFVERAIDLLGIIHTNVCGPMSISTHNGYHYFVTFTNDLIRYGYIYLMKHKSEIFKMFKEFQNEVKNQLDRKIRHLRSDQGGSI
jgi:hypothetical protein